ncbi:dockerin type I domain-containing protein [Pseudobacteroides cellulosolvens]
MWAGDLPVKEVQDGTINIADVVELAKAFNKVSTDTGFLTCADFNSDNSINMSDVIILAKNFNKTSAGYPAIN